MSNMVLPPFLQDICRRGRGPETWDLEGMRPQMVYRKRLDFSQGDGPMHPVGQINDCQGKWWVIPV